MHGGSIERRHRQQGGAVPQARPVHVVPMHAEGVAGLLGNKRQVVEAPCWHRGSIDLLERHHVGLLASQHVGDGDEGAPMGGRALQELLRAPGTMAQNFGGGFGGASGATAQTGDYLVTLDVGGRQYRQVLRVIAAPGGESSNSRFVEEEDR